VKIPKFKFLLLMPPSGSSCASKDLQKYIKWVLFAPRFGKAEEPGERLSAVEGSSCHFCLACPPFCAGLGGDGPCGHVACMPTAACPPSSNGRQASCTTCIAAEHSASPTARPVFPGGPLGATSPGRARRTAP
jgi:hypothetical protein